MIITNMPVTIFCISYVVFAFLSSYNFLRMDKHTQICCYTSIVRSDLPVRSQLLEFPNAKDTVPGFTV